MPRQKVEVLLIDYIHLLIRPYISGQDQLDSLTELFDSVPNVLCLVSCNTATWQYYLRVRAQRVLNINVLIMKPWSVDQFSVLIKNSCESVGITPDFSQVIIPRQFDDSHYEDPVDRAFYGFMRILHGAATGNPKLALGLWAKSLYVNKEGQIIVRLPRLPSTEELDSANLTMLLVLRVICRSEIVSYEDILKSLQISKAEVTTALRLASHKGWVNKVDGVYYQLNWYWLKPIVRVLARQNLMSRYV